jgi:predicted transcriptional regulator
MEVNNEELLTVQQAANFLGKSEAAVSWYLQVEQLTGVKVGYAQMFTHEELEPSQSPTR